MARRRPQVSWREVAFKGVRAFVADRGAVVWPEVEANLRENDWLQNHGVVDLAAGQGPDPHNLTTARRELLEAGELVPLPVVLSKRRVTAYVLADDLTRYGRKTEVQDEAAHKRRRYRTYLGWTSNPAFCGDVAEQIVHSTLIAMSGRELLLPTGLKPGQVRELWGDPIRVGGPLDAAGEYMLDPRRGSRGGFMPFAVEVKNIRGFVYPHAEEVWDLLAKVAAFPDVVPILIARRIHITAFRFFLDVGAIGFDWRLQPFAGPARINSDTFDHVRKTFGFTDIVQVDDTSKPNRAVNGFFGKALRQPPHDDPHGDPLIVRQAEKWERAAPIVERFVRLRESLSNQERHDLWTQFFDEMTDADLVQKGGWGPHDLS